MWLFKVNRGRLSVAALHLRKVFFCLGSELYPPFLLYPFLLTLVEETVRLYFTTFPVFRDQQLFVLSAEVRTDFKNPRTQAAEHILCAIRKKYLFALCVCEKKTNPAMFILKLNF